MRRRFRSLTCRVSDDHLRAHPRERGPSGDLEPPFCCGVLQGIRCEDAAVAGQRPHSTGFSVESSFSMWFSLLSVEHHHERLRQGCCDTGGDGDLTEAHHEAHLLLS